MLQVEIGGWWRHDVRKPNRVTRAMVARIVSFFRPYWREIVLMLLTMGAISTIGLAPPMLVRTLVDAAIPERNAHLLLLLALGMVASPTLAGLLGVAQTYLNTRISQQVMFDLRNRLYLHIQSLSLRFFTSVRTGEVMSRLTNDVSGISRVAGETLAQLVLQPLILISTLLLMMAMDWRLALLTLISVPALIAPTRRFGAMRFDLQRETQRKQADLTSIMQETLNISGFILMKTLARESYESLRFAQKNRELMEIQLKGSLLGRWFRMMVQVFEALGPALVFLAGGYLVISDEMTLGTVIAFVALLSRLYGPISQLANLHIELMGTLALCERVFEYLDLEPDIFDTPDALPLPAPAKGRIAFRDVSFAYIPEQQVLRRISFEVGTGQLVALVGPSGAGKTTITYLVPRLYDVTDGAVEIDGHDVRKVTLASLRSQIGVVTQETYLFNASLRENLRYAKLDATDGELEAACRAAQLEDVLAVLPQGLDTILGERGYRLSGGEKQRVAIARVILNDPRILILDEATSSLDSETEERLQAALKPLMKGRTTIAIAHRLSTVLAADRLLVLENGSLIESGTHAELLAYGGLYARLFEIQFKPQLTSAIPAALGVDS